MGGIAFPKGSEKQLSLERNLCKKRVYGQITLGNVASGFSLGLDN